MLSGVHTDTWGPYTLLSHIMTLLDQPAITIFQLIFGVILNPALNGFPLTVLTSFSSQQITQCVSMKIFNLNI